MNMITDFEDIEKGDRFFCRCILTGDVCYSTVKDVYNGVIKIVQDDHTDTDLYLTIDENGDYNIDGVLRNDMDIFNLTSSIRMDIEELLCIK